MTRSRQLPNAASPTTDGDSKTFRRRQEILDAAAQIFFEKGYDATSTKDIADAAGLLKGSLYYYVETKEDFLFEIIKESHDGALATLERVRAFDGEPLHQLAHLVQEHLHYFVENLVKTTVYFREFRVLSKERQQIIAAEGDVYLEFVRSLLARGQSEGAIDAAIDVRLVSIGIVGMLNSAWLWFQPGGARSTDEIAAEFVRIIVGGVASDRAVEQAGSLAQLRAMVAPDTSGRAPRKSPASSTTKRAGSKPAGSKRSATGRRTAQASSSD
jgi:TetR/AcrR family transcriptional regulator, cholesterol catabolism regulator